MRICISTIAVITALFIMVGLEANAFAFSGTPNERLEEEVIILSDDDDNDNHVWLGVQIEELTSKMRRELDVNARRGVVVKDVVDDSPADRAGIKKNDVIIKFDSRIVRRTKDLTREIHKHKAGDVVTVEVERDKDMVKIEVELGERPDKWFSKIDIPELDELKNLQIHGFSTGMGLGVQFQELNADLAEYFGADPGQGVLITEIEDDGPADKAGLKAGDVLLSIDGEEVSQPDDVVDILSECEEGEIVEVEILRKKQTQTIKVELEEGYGSSYFKLGKSLRSLPRIYMREYKDNLDRYKEGMERYKKDMKRWKDVYEQELKERIHKDVERNMEKLELQIERLQEEMKRLNEQVLELQKKVM